MKVKVEAPDFTLMHGRRPNWGKAWVDPGGTFLFGPGPYLKLPYRGGDLGRTYVWTRIFPPRRIARCKSWLLVREGDGWYWLTGRDARQVAAVVGREGG